MNFVLMLAPMLMSIVFQSAIERALALIRTSDWAGAAAALDQAYAEDAGLFAGNNLHYLRGRVAENQRDWKRARQEFEKVQPGNPLHELAVWHAALASARLRDDAAAKAYLQVLPRDFPADMRMQLARESSPALAAEIYREMSSRDARFGLARLTEDRAALWSLIRERRDDDAALEAAHIVAGAATTPKEQMDQAETYVDHRQFDYALPLYQAAAKDPVFSADARYQIGRIHFLRENYQLALTEYQALARDFAGTDWEKDADYQIASCYWRLGDFSNAEKAYLRYFSRYGAAGEQESAARNLVDVYRALGDEPKALAWIERMLARRGLAVSSRQVFLFTKAKILYTQKRYTAAQALFRQLATARLRNVAGGTTTEEARYFEALCLSKSGNKAAAEAIWSALAREPYSYYGLKAAEKLGRRTLRAAPPACSSVKDATLPAVENSLDRLRRPLRADLSMSGDAVAELTFLRLWDEASLWFERQNTRPDPRTGAELAYAGGRYRRSIAYADRLPESDKSRLPLVYPAGFREIVCAASRRFDVDPLWLHAIIWQESKYDPFARSGASARGLMQFIPETANDVGRAIGLNEFSLNRLYEPGVVIPMGAYYFDSLMKKLKHPAMALAAYNGGLTNVNRWKGKWPGAAADDLELFVADIGFIETKRYVMAVFAARAAYEELAR